MVERMNQEMSNEYQLLLQHLLHSFVFEEEDCPVGSELELTAMRHMKHLSYFAEELAESGHRLEFIDPELDQSDSISPALESDIALTEQARKRFAELSLHPDMQEHAGLRTELEHMVSQEEFLAATVGDLVPEQEAEASPEAPPEPEEQPQDTGTGFTVGSLIEE
jgi:hypothetical protein